MIRVRAAAVGRSCAALLACVALTVGVTGCRPEPVIAQPFIAPIGPSASPTVTPTPTPTATPSAVSPPISDLITIVHGQLLASEAEYNDAWQQGLSAYRMIDGTIIALDPAQPLPEAVTADIQSLLNAIGADTADTTDGVPRIEATQELAFDSASTGKKIAMVRLSTVRGKLQWVSLTSEMGWRMQVAPDLDALMTLLNTRIAADEDAADWVVFVGPAA